MEPPNAEDGPVVQPLTRRERDVVALLAQGVSTNRSLAEQMVVSENTIHYHLSSIMAKLGLHNRTDIVVYAFTSGVGSEATPLGRQLRA